LCPENHTQLGEGAPPLLGLCIVERFEAVRTITALLYFEVSTVTATIGLDMSVGAVINTSGGIMVNLCCQAIGCQCQHHWLQTWPNVVANSIYIMLWPQCATLTTIAQHQSNESCGAAWYKACCCFA